MPALAKFVLQDLVLTARDEALSDLNLAPPSTPEHMRVNLVFRVLLSLLASLVCWVPLRLLYKNGEFAAVVLIVCVIVFDTLTIVNSLLWPNDDVASWWTGDVWCDMHNYLYSPLMLLYTGCVLAIMRNLANQLGSMRASSLTSRERARRALVQAAVIFPLPLVQLAWIYPLSTQRYGLASLVGCFWIPDTSWPYIVFFVIPPPLLGFATAYYAILTYFRFRAVQKTTRPAFSNNQLAVSRAHRAERRLFYMALTILVPYLPLTVYFSVQNLISSLPLRPYDFAATHDPAIWPIVPPLTSDQLSFAFQNICYIPPLTAIPIFWFFGLTKDAVNTYRRYLLVLGLGKWWPALHEEYDPDSKLYATGSKWSGQETLGLPDLNSVGIQKDLVLDTSVLDPESGPGVASGANTITSPPPTAQQQQTSPSPSPSLSPQSRLSKPSWGIFGFGRKKSEFDNISSDQLAAASQRPGLFSRFGATTNRLNALAMQPHPSCATPPPRLAESPLSTPPPAPLKPLPDIATVTAGGWAAASLAPSAQSGTEVQTHVWSGDEHVKPAPAVEGQDSDVPSEGSGSGVVVTKSIDRTEGATLR